MPKRHLLRRVGTIDLNDVEMLPTDSNASQDNDIQIDSLPLNESSISEHNVEVPSNVKGKFFPTETKKISLKNASLPSIDFHNNDTAVLSTNSYDTHISNKHNNSENTKGKSHLTNEVSENISDDKNPGVLNDAEMLPTDSNISQDNDIQMDSLPLNESSISEHNVEVSSNVKGKSFPTETKQNYPKDRIFTFHRFPG